MYIDSVSVNCLSALLLPRLATPSPGKGGHVAESRCEKSHSWFGLQLEAQDVSLVLVAQIRKMMRWRGIGAIDDGMCLSGNRPGGLWTTVDDR